MNPASVSSIYRRSLLALAGTGFLLLLSGRPVLAESSDSDSSALAAAKAWVAQIDAGQYVESYDAGCDDFHRKVTQDKWILVLKAFRPAFGNVVERKEVSHVYKDYGFDGLDGQCMVINYETSFTRLQSGFETVVVKLEDGKWRGAGYTAGPKPSDGTQTDDEQGIDTQVQTTKTEHPDQ